jgi:hypothetical protein
MERYADEPRIRQRVDVLSHVRDGTIDREQAAMVLRLSSRQVRRLLATWLEQGPAGLVHGNRGRPPVNRTDAALRARIVELATETYEGPAGRTSPDCSRSASTSPSRNGPCDAGVEFWCPPMWSSTCPLWPRVAGPAGHEDATRVDT